MNESERKGDWMQTYTGKKFWPLDPRAEDVDVRDIAHSLALSCRFNGHCDVFYSVAQHSVLVSQIAKPPQQLVALLHDSAEAYLGDVIRPIKRFIPQIKEIEDNLERVIFQHFGIEKYDKDEIVHADNIALYTEMRDLMGKPPEMWSEFEYYLPFLQEQKIIPLNSAEGEILFLERYKELTGNID
jgi:hypothetical protein